MGEETDQTTDRAPSKRRLTVKEAAGVLGLSAEAVRSRIKRGTLPSTKEGETVYVLLDAAQTEPEHDRVSDQTTAQRSSEAYIASLEEQVLYLRDQLDKEREANAENRRIIMSLTHRIPELEPAPEPRESPKSASGGETELGASASDIEQPRASRRGWRRLFSR